MVFHAAIFTLTASLNIDSYPQSTLLCAYEEKPTSRLGMTSSFYSAANQVQAHGALPSKECYVHKRNGGKKRVIELDNWVDRGTDRPTDRIKVVSGQKKMKQIHTDQTTHQTLNHPPLHANEITEP